MIELNSPALWRDKLPVPQTDGHKYNRGHALIFAAPELSGATRLAATSCLRIGAGLVTVIAGDNAMVNLYRSCLPAGVMVRNDADMPAILSKADTLLGGPGGVEAGHLASMLRHDGVRRVFDADALNAAASTDGHCDASCVLTPHRGEFARCFPELDDSPDNMALAAAQQSGAIIVLKGSHTYIAAPDGRLAQNRHAGPWLATAGSGDALSGMIAGLLAQDMSAWEACCAAVWMHGEAALRFGPGLIADDLPVLIPSILADLLQ